MNDTTTAAQDGRTYEEYIADTLARWTVRDLIEQTDEDLFVAEEKIAKAEKDLRVIDQGQVDAIKWWKVESGDHEYECRRYLNFTFCSCKDFFFRKKMCKHLALTVKYCCPRCQIRLTDFGALCSYCEQATAPYFKNGGSDSSGQTEKVGSVRI